MVPLFVVDVERESVHTRRQMRDRESEEERDRERETVCVYE